MENKEIVLKALINEAKKEVGTVDLTNVTPKSLDMSEKDFNKALEELQYEGKISGLQGCEGKYFLYDKISISTENFKFG